MLYNKFQGCDAMKRKAVAVLMITIDLISIGVVVLILTVSPLQLKRTVFNIQLNDALPTDLEYYIKANDKVLNNSELHLEDVNTSTCAIYPAYITYAGKQYKFQIKVEDTKIPTVKLIDQQSVIQTFVGSEYKASDLVKVEDDSHYIVYFEDKNGEEHDTITLGKEGTYDYWIYAKDDYGNISNKLRIRFEVSGDQSKPVLSGIDSKTIKLNDDFDPLEGVSAIDNADGDLTHKIQVRGDVDTSQYGDYELTYTVSDSAGNVSVEKRLITVSDLRGSGQVDVADGVFLSSEQIEERNKKITTILAGLEDFSEKAFIKDLNKYLCNHFTPSTSVSDQSSHSVIVHERGNRVAMARAVKVLLDSKGMESVVVFGDIEGMAWNIVKVNQKYYHLDVYANAIGGSKQGVFLVGTSSLDDAHAYNTANYPQCN